MFTYHPPKSSIWGHSLRKMSAARGRELLTQFLSATTISFTFEGGSLGFFGAPPDRVETFERVIGVAAYRGSFPRLTQHQCNACIDEIDRGEQAGEAWMQRCVLTQTVSIRGWRVASKPDDAPSTMMMYYGMKPCVSTFLQFSTTEDFHSIRSALITLGLCRLNEKHLKPVRTGVGKRAGSGG